MQPINNKYTRWYYNIIANAQRQNRKKLKRNELNYVRFDNHHIIPECFFIARKRKGPPGWIEGNPNAKDNLILLTGKEHFICHVLLTKMFLGNNKHKMSFALGMMLVNNDDKNKRYIPNSRLYAMARLLVSAATSESNTGKAAWNKGISRPHSVKDAVSRANKGKTAWNKNLSRTYADCRKMKDGWETRKQLGKSCSPSNKGKKESKFLCLHCNNMIAGAGNFKRWHGDNCKMQTKK
jgi:hypothetical protein